jgi:predicted SnoaL-like aldol condensation-catalyzing enzyme
MISSPVPSTRARRGAALLALLCAALGTLIPTPAAAQARARLDQNLVLPPDTLARNKRNVLEFYDLAFNKGKPREAIDKYAGASYTQHNPEVPDGKDGFIWYFEKLARDYPDREVLFHRVFAEGHYVIVHTQQQFPAWLGATQWASIDIFRLDPDGRIVEHWDVLQKVPRGASSTNLNSMF